MLTDNCEPIHSVVLISADVEWQTVKEKLKPSLLNRSPYGEWFDQAYQIKDYPEVVRFFQGGWGKIAAAGSTQYVIDRFHPEKLINLGTCGGIKGQIERGTIILVTETIIYDIMEQMGDFDAHINHYRTQLDLSFIQKPYPMAVTLNRMVCGDRDLLKEDIPWLVDKFSAVAADWESGAIAYVASRNKIPVLILRGVTDLVGETGGEAYGNMGLFACNAATIMDELVDHVADWIACMRR